MRVAELTDARLVVELSEWDLGELERSFGVRLPGGTSLVPGRMTAEDGFCAHADEMRFLGADGAFTAAGLDGARRLAVAEAVCSLWPWVCDSFDVRFVGEDGELWCQGGHHLRVEVRAPRSSAALWTLLAALVAAAELALSLVMGSLEGVYGVVLINVLLAPLPALRGARPALVAFWGDGGPGRDEGAADARPRARVRILRGHGRRSRGRPGRVGGAAQARGPHD